MDPKELKRVRMVKRIAQEFPDGALVNLGIGMPTMVANYIPEGRTILLQSENGFTGLGPAAEKGKDSTKDMQARIHELQESVDNALLTLDRLRRMGKALEAL